MATLSTAKEIIKIAAACGRIPVCLVGGAGIGKSEMIKSFHTEFGAPVIDFRLSQVPAEDILGIPREHDGQFVYLAPWWWPSEPAPEVTFTIAHSKTITLRLGILFFDEINRARGDRHQAIFQLLTDNRIGNRVLPEGWMIVSAVNPSNGDYQVNELEKALRGRFLFTGVEFCPNEWSAWAKTSSQKIPGFAFDLVEGHGLPVERIDTGEYADPQPRTFARAAQIAGFLGADHPLLPLCASGLLGTEYAGVFMTYANEDGKFPLTWNSWSEMSARDAARIAKEYSDEGRSDLAAATLRNAIGGLKRWERESWAATGGFADPVRVIAEKIAAYINNLHLDLLAANLTQIFEVDSLRSLARQNADFRRNVYRVLGAIDQAN